MQRISHCFIGTQLPYLVQNLAGKHFSQVSFITVLIKAFCIKELFIYCLNQPETQMFKI